MKPVALLMNDLHIGKDNVLEFEKNWNEALKVCEENEIKQIYIGGDVFTTRNVQHLVPLLTVMRCLERTTQKGIETTVAFGNHDCPIYGEKESWCDVLGYVDGVEVINDIMVTDLGGVAFAMVAYFPEETMMVNKLKELDKMLGELRVECCDTVVYLHSGVHGALGDMDIPNEMPQEPLLKYRKVLCGHYHNRTAIPDTNIEYIGSSRAHNFGEDEEKGYTLIYEDGTISFVKNEVNIRYVTEDVMLENLSEWERHVDDRYKVRLRIHCQAAEADIVDKTELLARGANKIEFVTEKLKAIESSQTEIDERFDNKNLQKEYKSFCKEKDIDSRFGMDYLTKAK